MTTGKYVVIEGNDGTGKTTQINLLANWLKGEKGVSSFVVEEPAGTPIADELKVIIKNKSLSREAKTNLLLFTATRHEIWQQAKRELAKGKWVLSSRNYFSTLAYQGYGEGLDLGLIHQITEQFTDKKYLTPDIAIVLALEDEARITRIENRSAKEAKLDTFESKDDSFQKRVNEGYLQIAKSKNLKTIDASQTIEEIQLEIRNLIF